VRTNTTMHRDNSSPLTNKTEEASATLYLMRANMSAKVIANLKSARRLLRKIGISGKRVKEVDLTTDFNLRDKILQKVGRNRQFPLIFIDQQAIGDVDDLNAWIEEHTSQSPKVTPTKDEKSTVSPRSLSTSPPQRPSLENYSPQVDTSISDPPQHIITKYTEVNGNVENSPPFKEILVDEEFSDSDEHMPKSPRSVATSSLQSQNPSGRRDEKSTASSSPPRVIPIQQIDSVMWEYTPSEATKRISTSPNSNSSVDSGNVVKDSVLVEPPHSPRSSSLSNSSTSSSVTARNETTVNKKQKDVEIAESRLNLLGKTLASVESVVQSLANWWRQSPASTTTTPPSTQSDALPSDTSTAEVTQRELKTQDVEFVVVQTNWYWRRTTPIPR
jgi:glutaredoxin